MAISQMLKDHEMVVYDFVKRELTKGATTVDLAKYKDLQTITSFVAYESHVWEITTQHDEHGFVVHTSTSKIAGNVLQEW